MDSAIYYCSNNPEALLDDCRDRVIPIRENVGEAMEDVCRILRRSNLPQKKIEKLCDDFSAPDPGTHNIFLRDVWLYSMRHRELPILQILVLMCFLP